MIAQGRLQSHFVNRYLKPHETLQGLLTMPDPQLLLHTQLIAGFFTAGLLDST